MSSILQSDLNTGTTLKDASCWVSVMVFNGLLDSHWDIHRFPTWFAMRLAMKSDNVAKLFKTDYHNIELDLKQIFLEAPLDDIDNYIISEVKSIFRDLRLDPIGFKGQLRFLNQNHRLSLIIKYGRNL